MKITKDNLEAAAFELRDLAALLNLYDKSAAFAGKSDICLDTSDYFLETDRKDQLYQSKLFEVFTKTGAETQIAQLTAECEKAIAEVELYRQAKAELQGASCSRPVYWALFKQNTRRILHAIARLSFAVDLFAVSYNTNYSRTLDTVQAQKQKMLDNLLDELNGVKKQTVTNIATANADTDAAPENHNRFGEGKSGAGGTMPNNCQNS